MHSPKTIKSIFATGILSLALSPISLACATSCGDTLSANTTLAEDLFNCPSTGLNLNNGITLDCAGHTLTGAGDGREQWGIRIDTVHDVQVRNCYVSGFQRGVRIKDSSNIRVQNMRASGNGDFILKKGYGMSIDSSHDVVVPGGQFYDNADEQVHLGGSMNVGFEFSKFRLPYFVVNGVPVRSDREQLYALDSGNVECLRCTFGPGKQSHRKNVTSAGIVRSVTSNTTPTRYTVKWTLE